MTSTPIAAIPTRYAGCHFRSRLEARWAVFFDRLGIRWEYEPQGYLVDGNPYLPDFYLPTPEIWVEVKGSEEDLIRNQQRIMGAAFALGNILILGPVPDANRGVPFHVLLERHIDEGDDPMVCVHLATACMLTGNSLHSRSVCGNVGFEEGALPLELPPWDLMDNGRNPQSSYTNPDLSMGIRAAWRQADAYTAARSARFEHGESPR